MPTPSAEHGWGALVVAVVVVAIFVVAVVPVLPLCLLLLLLLLPVVMAVMMPTVILVLLLRSYLLVHGPPAGQMSGTGSFVTGMTKSRAFITASSSRSSPAASAPPVGCKSDKALSVSGLPFLSCYSSSAFIDICRGFATTRLRGSCRDQRLIRE